MDDADEHKISTLQIQYKRRLEKRRLEEQKELEELVNQMDDEDQHKISGI